MSRVFAQLLADSNLPSEVVDVISVIVEGYADSTEGFAFCLSEKGDLLSQWRAYSKDGSGIAIGFSTDLLMKDFGQVNFGAQFYELTKVEYGEAMLYQTLKPLADEVGAEFAKYGSFVRLRNGATREYAIGVLSDRGADAQGLFQGVWIETPELLSRLLKALSPMHFQIYGTKPTHFHEECEWRLLRYRHRAALPDIEYFADDHSFRPYISCLIADPAREAIREVVLGPKHKSDLNWVRAFLASVGLSHVLVKRSAIDSYR